METPKVWVPNPNDGYKLGRIIDIGSETVSVQLIGEPDTILSVPYEHLHASVEDETKDVDDNCSLMFLNEATLLNNVRLRYKRDQIYTYVANILLAVNPYHEMKDLYSSGTISRYQGRSLGVLPPHVFAIADKAFRDMRALKASQSIIVSGESGAGKTESTKYILRYLCESWGCQAGPIEQRILDANPVLEAFGNAKTMRNNNSSRFGKFIEIHFSNKYSVVGGYISHYLLEKSRVCFQNKGECNYHIFYQLCAGAPAKLKEKLNLSCPDKYQYLNKSFSTRKEDKSNQLSSAIDPTLDDVKNFAAMNKALSNMGLSESERDDIYAVVAAVLHLGNVTFEDNPEDSKGGCRMSSDSSSSLSIVSKLLGVDSQYLCQSLLSRVMQTSKGGAKGTIYMVPLKVHEAQSARDALAKALYSRLFDYIVQRINKSIPFSTSSYYIGVLDIAGFEYFQVNSFEQFCINYCNEKLQQFFNERILKEEQALYEKEGLNIRKIKYVDNQDCIDLLESKGNGIFDVLDEESRLPRSSHVHFTATVHSKHKGHNRLDVPRKSKLKDHREIRDDEGFLIRHFAGAVCYETVGFIEKNNDALHASLETVMTESENTFVQNLFKTVPTAQNTRGKLNFVSVGSKFRMQLNDLMLKLHNTGTHFIRCLKPNFKMADHCFEGNQILVQLRCSGMISVLELMQQGYPSRAQFSELYGMYKNYLPTDLVHLDPRLFCKALFKALGLDENDFCFGLTKVFFRPGKFAEFDQIMKSDPENLAFLVSKVKKWLLVSRWKKVIWCALSVVKLKNKIIYRRQKIVLLQKNFRMCVAKRKYRPRYMGILKLKSLHGRVQTLMVVAKQLKRDREQSLSKVGALESKLNGEIQKLKMKGREPENIEKEYQKLVAAMDELLVLLKNKLEQEKAAEEQERLRKIQEEIEAEKRRQQYEEKKKQEEEELKRRRLELEALRKSEEALIINKMNELKVDEQYQAQLLAQEEEELRRQQQLQQEHTDHELALRLAQDMNGTVEDVVSPPPLLRSAYILQQQEQLASKKYDLSKWKYSDLRDAINTSCDLDLLEACREEFHRRLKVYHTWKSKNQKKGSVPNERAPESVMASARAASQLLPHKQQTACGNRHRFFRIPFVRPSCLQKGWWYAHFNGQWISRQMELHPDKPPILLVAGKDDMQMCELSLNETGLTHKRGAEILEEEFESEWVKHGGKTFNCHTSTK